MQDSNLKVGDKVRYKHDGRTTPMRGLEGIITERYPESCAVEITKSNGIRLWSVGESFYPDLDNLELIVEGTLPAEAAAGVMTNLSIDGKDVEAVVHPAHYGGDTVYEVIKVAEAWGLDKDAYLFNVIKYVGRAGKKSKATLLEDLKKARFYLDRRIKALEEALANNKD